MEKTIAAVSTPPGAGGIAIIRISGSQALFIGDRVFSGKDKLAGAATHTIHYGFAVNETGERIDQVLVSVMRGPRTFTGEDVVEINTHGGTLVTRRVLEAVIRAGAVPAAAGEFTKRAFLNGHMDLSQAEAVIDLINANNELAQKSAFQQLEGALSEKIGQVRDRLVQLSAHMQVAIDYPDEDLEDITPGDILNTLKACKSQISKLLSTADQGKILRDGIQTVIAGKPNVGKSSLLNSLAGTDRAIVTEIAGTTRDVIEEAVNLGGVPLRLVDTAGIRETQDVVEKIGVERSKASLEDADLILAVLDSTTALEEEDREVLQATQGKKRIILINKTDVQGAELLSQVRRLAGESPVLEISAKTGNGLETLGALIREQYHLGNLNQGSEPVITNLRHKAALSQAEKALERAISAMEAGMPQDIASIDMNLAMEYLGEIIGTTVSEDIVSAIFHNFCVGK